MKTRYSAFKRQLRLSSLALIAAGSAASQIPDTTVLDPVVVTATRLSTPQSSVISTISVIEVDHLRVRGMNLVSEAMRTVAGMSVAETGSLGSATSVFVRGGESDYLKVLVDGVAQNDPGGAFDFADLTLDNIERVEIVRGPASVLYGSDAMAGVVQLFTKRGTGKPRLEAGIRGGTYGSMEIDASASGGGGSVGFSAGAMRSTTDGIYELNSGFDNLVLSGTLTMRPDELTDALLSARYGDSEFQFPTDGSGQIVDANAFQERRRLSVSLDVGRFVSSKLELRGLFALNRTSGGLDDRSDDVADTLGFYGFVSSGTVDRSSVDLRANLHLAPAAVLTGGVQLEKQAERSSSESLSQWGPSYDSLDVTRESRGYYGQLQVEPVKDVTLNGGARVDDNDTFGTFATYRVGVALRRGHGTSLRASLGRAFKEPTFYENFANSPYAVGNPELRPERSLSWEIGVVQRLPDHVLVIGATYFSQRFEDLIQYNVVPQNPGDPSYVNIAAAKASGLEFDARSEFALPFEIGAHYTYLHTVVTNAGLDDGPDAGFVEGERLLRRPTHRAGVNLRYHASGFGSVSANFDYVGRRDDRDFTEFPAERVELPAYLRVDLAGELTVLAARGVRPRLRLTVRIENLLDHGYEEVVGFPARGRVMLVGARMGGR